MVTCRRGLLCAALLLASLVVPLGGAADARRHAPPTDVGVGAREYHLSAYRASVPHGVVRFDLVNYGEDGHDLVVQTRGGRDVARTGTVKAGRRARLSVRLAPGTYRLICDLADHERRGMRTTLKVTR